jgi:hypothetical protein
MAEETDEQSSRKRGAIWIGVAALVAAVAAATVVLLSSGGSGTDTANAQTIHFQSPTDPGDNAFTPATDAPGNTTVRYPPASSGGGGVSPSSEPSSGHGTFGGSGSDYVCDREKLIKELLARPDRMRGWAETLGVDPTPQAVAKYIRGLRPVTLTQDTQITDYAFLNGHVVGYQAILQAGTAVLVDKYGRPVAKCRCGNPVTEADYSIKDAKCPGCPPNYTPPPRCKYRPYDPYDQQYSPDPSTGEYLEPAPTYVTYKKNAYSTCYIFYPQPPTTKSYARTPSAETSTTPTTTYSQPSYTQTYPTHTYSQPSGCCGGSTGYGGSTGSTGYGGSTGTTDYGSTTPGDCFDEHGNPC